MQKDSPHAPSINAASPTPSHREVDRLLDQMDRIFRAEAWHGPALMQLLTPVSATAAIQRPLPARHNIWELTAHLTAWVEIAQRRLMGECTDVTPEEDWPPVAEAAKGDRERVDSAWRETLSRLERSWSALELSVKSLDDNKLGKRVPGCPYTVYILVHGAIQHLAYHAGQIAILSLLS